MMGIEKGGGERKINKKRLGYKSVYLAGTKTPDFDPYRGINWVWLH